MDSIGPGIDSPGGPNPEVVGLAPCGPFRLVWRARDLRALRGCWGLVGALLGPLPRSPRQDGRRGRPLLLLPEEEALLRGAGAAGRLPGPGGVEGAELSRLGAELEASLQEQRLLALQDRRAALVRAANADPGGPVRRRLLDLDRTFSFPPAAMTVQLSTCRAGLRHRPEARRQLQPMGGEHRQPMGGEPMGEENSQPMGGEHSQLMLEEPLEEQNSQQPMGEEDLDEQQSARQQVFRDLRGRGFFLTSAGKFGGDFLVYPGDPLVFHAHFIALVLPPRRPLPLLDLLVLARLGSNVRKTVLLCSPGPGAVNYSSLQWSGMA
ncbi:tRNA-splicing endonuclease subunit Sen34 [Menidia menidia]